MLAQMASIKNGVGVPSLKNLLLFFFCSIITLVASSSIQDEIWDRKVSIEELSSGSHAETRIYNGAPVPQSDAVLFIASIQVQFSAGEPYIHFCAGSLMEELRIATTAHCLYPLKVYPNNDKLKYRVLINTTDLAQPSPLMASFGMNDVEIDDRWRGSGDKNPHSYDFAVIKLRYPLKLNKTQIPACPGDYLSEEVKVYGWGKYDCHNTSRHMLYAVGKIIPNAKCEEMLSKAYKKKIQIGEDKLCALFKDPTQSSHPANVDLADNGGPLIGKMRGIPLENALIGLASFAFKDLTEPNNCVRNDLPQIFAKASIGRDFLRGKPDNYECRVSTEPGLRPDINHVVLLIIFFCYKTSR